MNRVVTVKPFIRENSSLAHLGIEYHSRTRLRVKVRTPKTDALDAIKRRRQSEQASIGSIRNRAKKLGVPFDLTIEQTREVRQRPCAYCETTNYPRQLDRIVPAEGYVIENMAAACKRCNMVKSRWLSFDEMRKVAEVLGWRE